MPRNTPQPRHRPSGESSYTQWSPSGIDGRFELLWYAEGASLDPRHRILPNGMVELLVNCGPPLRLIEEGATKEPGRAWLSCVHSRALTVETENHYRVLGLRLAPEVARSLFGRPMAELCGSPVDLDELGGSGARELGERCLSATSVAERFERVVGWLESRRAHEAATGTSVLQIASRIRGSGGTLPIEVLREGSGMSRARLVAAFRDQVGVTPKVYARIARFRRTLALLTRPHASLVDVALAAGFCDQPHMNAEFRVLGGITPREFVVAASPGDPAAIEAMGLVSGA